MTDYSHLNRVQGTPLSDRPISNYLHPDMIPGAYWFVTTPDGSRRLDVRNGPSTDIAAWVGSEPNAEDRYRYQSNLTGHVLCVMDPLGHIGMLSLHTVRPEADGTVSVRAGDGSSNSILIKRREDEPWWHGYIEHGVWIGQVENI